MCTSAKNYLAVLKEKLLKQRFSSKVRNTVIYFLFIKFIMYAALDRHVNLPRNTYTYVMVYIVRVQY